MEYYSVRNGIKIVLAKEFYARFSLMMENFAIHDYFKEHLKIKGNSIDPDYPNYINKKSYSHIGISIYPFSQWQDEIQKANLVFDTIEFLYNFISKPGEFGYIPNHTGWNNEDYLSYDKILGREEFRGEINILLNAFNQGYELQLDGQILFVGDETVNFIRTEFPSYNEINIDNEIHLSIKWWKNRNQTLEDKKMAILKLAGVLEYLKKDSTLTNVMDKKDTNDLFNIANNFGLRHHNLDQQTNYDKDIWYDWIFQYYLNTCISVLKLIQKNKD
jgi:hypothetical protein